MVYSLCGGTKNCAPPLADGGGGGRTRKHMDVFQFIGYLRQFSVDVALIGAAVWGIGLLLRRTPAQKGKGKARSLSCPFCSASRCMRRMPRRRAGSRRARTLPPC